MNTPIRSRNINPAYQEKVDAREAWIKLVVKVLNWGDGRVVKDDPSQKITKKEWRVYWEKTVAINISKPKDQVVQKLKEVEEKIRSFNGFA